MGNTTKSMPNVSSNTFKFLIGSLVGAVCMMIIDMNEIFVQVAKDAIIARGGQTLVPILGSESIGDAPVPIPPPPPPPPTTTTTAITPSPISIQVEERNPYLNRMKGDLSLMRSFSQLSSAWKKKDLLPDMFDRRIRFNTDPGDYGAAILSDDFALLHIWANTDPLIMSSIEKQFNSVQCRKDRAEIKRRRWMAWVQDPMQHFLQGWAMAELKILEEVKSKGHDDLAAKMMASWESPDKTYDARVSEFLDRVLEYAKFDATVYVSPLMHALPQTNFLLDDAGMFDSNIALIGDTSEWEAILNLVGYPGDISQIKPKGPTTIQSKYFPIETNRLTRKTTLRLCEFLAMDYYLLSYEAPSSCLVKDGPLDFSDRRILLPVNDDTITI